jgi:hypothetical protein
MKTFGIILTVLFSVVLILDITNGILGSYQYEKNIQSYWNLADKASTIPQKSEYINKFVVALEESRFEGKYNAIFLETPDNSFDLNLEALKTLQQRLKEIETMDVTSFEYQTAMQQITGQEQGEAYNMLKIFKGIWWKENHFLLWNWICAVNIILSIIFIIIGVFIWIEESD